VLTPMMEPATPIVAAIILGIAGVYQFLPIKFTCLQACRSPIAFFTQHWRPGIAGAFRMGVRHGLYCLGCCWALMLLLFAGGVMNLLVIVALTVWVIVEKTAPFGEKGARAMGAVLIGMAVWMLVRS
jgi:predicted metal-binding membrane protein